MKLRPLFLLLTVIAAVVGTARWLRQDPRGSRPDPGIASVAPVTASVLRYESQIGVTVFPGRIEQPTPLHFIVDAPVFQRADTSSVVVFQVLAGDTVVASSEMPGNAERWFEITSGFVPASVVDRFASSIEGDLEVGREGLVNGKNMPLNYAPADLERVPRELLAPGSLSRRVRLRRGAVAAFSSLIEAAAADGIELKILSGFRSGSYQASLYSAQLASRGFFQNVSAPPGRSEHQLGTTVDFFAVGSTPLDVSLGEAAAGRWLEGNVDRFGLVLSFSRQRHRARGIAYEPWHVRWVNYETDERLW